jgi:hypothetical protein
MIKTIVDDYIVRTYRENDKCITSIHLKRTYALISRQVLVDYHWTAFDDERLSFVAMKHLMICQNVLNFGPYDTKDWG